MNIEQLPNNLALMGINHAPTVRKNITRRGELKARLLRPALGMHRSTQKQDTLM